MKIFGPYLKKSNENKWHWMENCPDFPGMKGVISMVSSKPVFSKEACFKCMKLEGKNLRNGEQNYRINQFNG